MVLECLQSLGIGLCGIICWKLILDSDLRYF